MLTGKEVINGLVDKPTLADFWQWAYGNVLANDVRPVLAEYIITKCLGQEQQPRIAWNYVDVIYREVKIEIKTSSYLQAWKQSKKLTDSTVNFNINKSKKAWNEKENITYTVEKRYADVYIFCMYTEKKDKHVEKVLALQHWDFYILTTAQINKQLGNQQTVTLSKIKKLTKGIKIGFVKKEIDALIDNFLISV